MNILEIARWLNQGGLSAAPCAWLSAVSIFVDEEYEKSDYDLIGPRDRLRIASVLEEHGYRQRTGREFEGPLGRIEFPRPSRTLSSDPASELEQVLDCGSGAAFATPTQILLATWRREGPSLSESRHKDLIGLVREQPANLEKIRDWLRRTDRRPDFELMMPKLNTVQREGFEQRRKGTFRSQLPH
jgi:hypothetical protein